MQADDYYPEREQSVAEDAFDVLVTALGDDPLWHKVMEGIEEYRRLADSASGLEGILAISSAHE